MHIICMFKCICEYTHRSKKRPPYPMHPPRSRGSTLRSNSRPLGRTDSQKVHDGNIMTSRCMILCILAAAKGVWWLVEQPATSIMELHPSFQIALKLLAPIRRLRVLMSDFGGSSKKPTYLYSSSMACASNLFSTLEAVTWFFV